MKLSELNEHAAARVVSAEGAPSNKRLAALGMEQGTEIVKLFTAPCGDPSAYLIKGAAVALRMSDAEKIIVERSAEWETK